MSEKKAKRARQLAYHATFGGYIPAVMKSKKKYEALDLSARQRNKRIPDLVARKAKKVQVIRARQELD